ncbi:hypothetical protein RRG08_059681 [Elysia crispata]|uniref:Uncharacterized protein n=1 Tax=Elysia crispata TaxID=231223 RepID=A0AAE1EA97_9GAST|nr:hypothetical protein RRG08_059681 [Elysia crispata]
MVIETSPLAKYRKRCPALVNCLSLICIHKRRKPNRLKISAADVAISRPRFGRGIRKLLIGQLSFSNNDDA